MKIAFLGTGNMGSALICGALDAGILKPNQVTAYDLEKERLLSLARRKKIEIASSNIEAVKKADFIFLCVKPQQMENLLLEIREHITKKKCLISIAAGILTRTLENYFSVRVPVVRVMPNTPALVRCGIAAVTKGRFASRPQLQFAMTFFSSVGEVVQLEEKYFDAVTAISGSGPAYLFYLTESLSLAGQKLGLSKSVAELLSKWTCLGSGKMLTNSVSAVELRRKVTSPGGTTESAIHYLEKKNWQKIFMEAIEKARNRSQELSLPQKEKVWRKQ